MTRFRKVATAIAVVTALAAPSQAQRRDEARRPLDEAGVARLAADTNGDAEVSLHSATRAARFVRIRPGRRSQALPTPAGPVVAETARGERSRAFFRNYGGVFGVRDEAAELQQVSVAADRIRGGTHVTYRQRYRGLPVFGAELKSHFDASDRLQAVNGTFVPEIALDANPTRSAEEASRAAVRIVETKLGRSGQLAARGAAELLVFRAGLAQGIPGANHLTWKVEVGDGSGVREFVFMDAHTGKFVDQITGTPDSLYRRAYNGLNLPTVPPSYPGSPFWVEGNPFPTGTVEADNMIISSQETYDFYKNAFGRDSFDNAGATMDAIFNRGYQCPNASWNGVFISFCPGLTTDDVTGHEWSHAYTEYTDNLIYQWQPGALNEAASDIFGETIDRINGRGGDSPDVARNAGSCTVFTAPPPLVVINAPAAIAGLKGSGSAAFGPQSFSLTSDVVLADDGFGVTNDGCCAGPSFACAANSWPNAAAIAGKIAMVDRGVCGFAIKVKNAQLNGAIGVLVGNNQGGDVLINMAGVDATVTIPSVSVSQNNGTALKAQLATTTVNASISRPAGTDNSVRWLLGEDDTAAGLSGALRDMWNPNCYGHPGKVSDAQYTCGTGDNGGVHSNSGVDNHAYSLMVDGGSYNGQTITGIGLTKSAHVYFRAKTHYQGPATDFAEHADALEQSCADLVGTNLPSLTTGAPSGEILSAGDCTQVAKAILAVEMRNPPVQCAFQPVLAQNPPDRCGPGTTQANVFFDDFESAPAGWTASHDAVVPADFTPRDWAWTSTLPGGRAGSALFGIDYPGGTCAPGGDESGVLHIDSPSITLPAGASAPLVTFDHWVSTEAGWDGANLKVSVNGGLWTLVAAADYSFNPYNGTLFTAAEGNTNPLAGEAAFTASDGGSVSGSWGRSHVNLTAYAVPGDSVRLRYDIGNDGCSGTFGWYVDDVTLYACTSNTKPTIAIDDAAVVMEGSRHNDPDVVFTVTLSQPYAQPVTVRFETEDGSAKHDSDYKKTKGKLTIPPLSLSGTISVPVKGDKKFEKNETFYIVLSRPENATITDKVGLGTILNDDPRKHHHDRCNHGRDHDDCHNHSHGHDHDRKGDDRRH